MLTGLSTVDNCILCNKKFQIIVSVRRYTNYIYVTGSVSMCVWIENADAITLNEKSLDIVY